MLFTVSGITAIADKFFGNFDKNDDFFCILLILRHGLNAIKKFFEVILHIPFSLTFTYTSLQLLKMNLKQVVAFSRRSIRTSQSSGQWSFQLPKYKHVRQTSVSRVLDLGVVKSDQTYYHVSPYMQQPLQRKRPLQRTSGA